MFSNLLCRELENEDVAHSRPYEVLWLPVRLTAPDKHLHYCSEYCVGLDDL